MPRPRRSLVALLLLLGSIATFVGSFAWWLDRQALSPSGWQATSSRLIASPQVRRGVGTFAVDELFARANAADALRSVLPGALADPLLRRLHSLGSKLAEEILASQPAQAVWDSANRQAHRDLLRILDEDRDRPGEVALNLTPLLKDLVRAIDSSAPVQALPGGAAPLFSVGSPDAGRVPILRADQVDQARTAVNAIRGLSVLLGVAALLLLAGAVALARGWRATALRRAGYGLIVVGALVLIARAVIAPPLSDALVSAAYRPAARAAWTISTSELRNVAVGILIAGGVLVVSGLVARVLAPPRRQPA